MQPQFYDVSGLVHREVQTDLSVAPQVAVREVWPEYPGYLQCFAAVARHDDATAPSPDGHRHEGPLGEAGRDQAAAQPARLAEEPDEHRSLGPYGAAPPSHQAGGAIAVQVLLTPGESGLGAPPQPSAPWQIVAATLMWTVGTSDTAPQPFAAQVVAPATSLSRALGSECAAQASASSAPSASQEDVVMKEPPQRVSVAPARPLKYKVGVLPGDMSYCS